ncbi:acyl carrier protein [Pseudobutyrivibrio sp.]|uniref:phosphopantetheine-binding protein n=1 Tax=Pseudobutyrivibrio sp. TaxID=2014367 RepID=UPI0025F5010A|nr:phosphopantetheine-binding protein [Pseudobutyrivibrio sp.]MBQ6464065.1 acyl carrier protein [Pseudobutyrivibrio sp.]
MKNKVLEILEGVRPDIDYASEDNLVDGGVLESFDIVAIIAQFESEFNIEVEPQYLTAAHFNSLDAMVSLVELLSK